MWVVYLNIFSFCTGLLVAKFSDLKCGYVYNIYIIIAFSLSLSRLSLSLSFYMIMIYRSPLSSQT